jgi:hypothetical protein
MADGDTTPEQLALPTDTPPVEVSPPEGDTPPSEPTDAERLAQEREARIRLEGKVEGLTAQPKPPAAPPPPQQRITPEMVEAAYARAEITEAQRIAHLANIVADEKFRERDVQEREHRTRTAASEKLGEYLREYPDLNDRTSDLLGKVREEMDAMVEADPTTDRNDPRKQLMAVRLVVSGHRLGGPAVSDREFNRRRAPAGGAGSPGGSPGGPASTPASPLKGIPATTVDYWRSHGWLPDTAAEKRYAERWHAQQSRRRSRITA